jgi:hypothetical protein
VVVEEEEPSGSVEGEPTSTGREVTIGDAAPGGGGEGVDSGSTISNHGIKTSIDQGKRPRRSPTAAANASRRTVRQSTALMRTRS